MSFDVNRLFLIGRLGKDPEMRYTQDGQAVTTFSLATNRPTRPGAEPATDWHDVVCWDKTAEFANEYFAKGRRVFIGGRLTYRTWEGRDGVKRRTAEVVANELIPLDPRPAAPPADGTAADGEPAQGDDVPF